MEFLADPAVAGTAQSIGAFSSLHVSIFFTAALAAHLLGINRRVQIGHLGAARADHHGHRLLRLALRARRRRRADDRRHGDRHRPRPHRLRPAHGRAGCRRRIPRRRDDAGDAVAAIAAVAQCGGGPGGGDRRDRHGADRDATRSGSPLRDPDHVAALYLGLVGFGMLLLVGFDIVVRAGSARRRGFPRRAGRCAQVRRERWTPWRGFAVAAALISFYATYLAYRNLKSIVPLLRPDELFDRQLADLDRGLFAGHDPAAAGCTPCWAPASRPTSSRPPTWPSSSSCRARSASRWSSRATSRAALFYTDRPVAELGAGHRQLPPAALARTDLRHPGRVREPARLRGHPPAGRPARPADRVPRATRRPGRRRASRPSPRCTSR